MLHQRLLRRLEESGDSPFGAAGRAASEAMLGEPELEADLDAALSSPATALHLLWKCAATARGGNGAAARSSEFVATLPSGVPNGARPTNIVVREMLEAARTQIVVLGYAFTAAGGILDRLLGAAARGVSVLIVCDRTNGGLTEIDENWPTFLPLPLIYVNSESDDPMQKMHCKMMIVDEQDMLITSANFTYHGMLANIEFGVRLRDVASSKAAGAFVEHLIQTKSVVPPRVRSR